MRSIGTDRQAGGPAGALTSGMALAVLLTQVPTRSPNFHSARPCDHLDTDPDLHLDVSVSAPFLLEGTDSGHIKSALLGDSQRTWEPPFTSLTCSGLCSSRVLPASLGMGQGTRRPQ